MKIKLQRILQKFSIWLFRKSFDLTDNKSKGKGKEER
jgi:hypothetical protein